MLNLSSNFSQPCIHSMPASGLAETTQVREILSTFPARKLTSPQRKFSRER